MERVRRAEAARILGLDKATVTRWVQKNPALLDDRGLVSVAELQAHRDATINPKLQTRGVGAQGAAHGSEADDTQPAVPEPREARESGAGSQLNTHRTRHEAVRAQAAELDLAERLGLTLRRQDVEAAVASAAETIRQAAAQVAKDRAELLARIDDPRAMERALDELMRELLDKAAAALSAAAQDGTARDAA